MNAATAITCPCGCAPVAHCAAPVYQYAECEASELAAGEVVQYKGRRYVVRAIEKPAGGSLVILTIERHRLAGDGRAPRETVCVNDFTRFQAFRLPPCGRPICEVCADSIEPPRCPAHRGTTL